MSQTPSDSGSETRATQDPGHPDSSGGADAAAEHDRSERGSGSPYVAPGRDEQGEPQPAVPHEGLLGRIATAVIAGQSVVLAVVAIAGYVVSAGESFTSQADTTFLALRLNPAHSTLLLITALLGAAALARRRTLRAYTILQTVVYLLVFVFGTAFSASTPSRTPLDLNPPDHVLHALLALIGFIVLYIASARIVEPPPGPLPYPEVTHDGADTGRG